MSDRDPNIIGHSYSPFMNTHTRLNPAASSYAPGSQPHNNMSSQVSPPPSPYLESRIDSLEDGHASLREDVDSITEMYHRLSSSVDKLQKGGWPVTVGPFQEQELKMSHLRAMEFKQELEELSREVHESVDGVPDVEKVNGTVTPKANRSMPPHMRAAGGASNGVGSKTLPPHLRGKIVDV
jgi:hypothetical protein